MTEQLSIHIQKLLPGLKIPLEQMTHFFHTVPVKKNEILLNDGQICDKIYFVNKGGLYLYYYLNGQKQVIHFAIENWWLTDYKTFSDSRPAEYTIGAMVDSEITFLSRADYDALQLQFPLMALYFNKIHERAYGAALLKQKTFAITSKNDFYHYFRSTYPTLTPIVTDPILAAYMGISPEALQKIKDN